jgi:hypothetical protein
MWKSTSSPVPRAATVRSAAVVAVAAVAIGTAAIGRVADAIKLDSYRVMRELGESRALSLLRIRRVL